MTPRIDTEPPDAAADATANDAGSPRAPFELPADCTLAAAPALHAKLLAELVAHGEPGSDDTLTVSARAVASIDAAGAQLLVAFVFSAGDAGVFVNFVSPSPTFARTTRRLGLDPMLS